MWMLCIRKNAIDIDFLNHNKSEHLVNFGLDIAIPDR